ncbi:hypothetical protein HDE_03841 [Halotydeus destructor]|nr:hypothetical protein HDE_03841 [Halotydeus destructor]
MFTSTMAKLTSHVALLLSLSAILVNQVVLGANSEEMQEEEAEGITGVLRTILGVGVFAVATVIGGILPLGLGDGIGQVGQMAATALIGKGLHGLFDGGIPLAKDAISMVAEVAQQIINGMSGGS